MSKRFIYGAYSNLDEVQIVAADLKSHGVSESSITIIANQTSDASTTSNFPITLVNQEENPETNKSWWDKLLGFITDDEHNATDDYNEYQSALRDGQYLLVLDKSYDNLIESDEGTNLNNTYINKSVSNEARAEEIASHQVIPDDTGFIRDPHMPVSGLPINSTTIEEDLMNDPDVPTND